MAMNLGRWQETSRRTLTARPHGGKDDSEPITQTTSGIFDKSREAKREEGGGGCGGIPHSDIVWAQKDERGRDRVATRIETLFVANEIF
ncbi:hypothetical protein CDAR_597291 [Caerostris darwini]|uniref:Uncharacterized protein n=1 Tax=Caerostris darwini TaxID=1538125 RepID=A0AAV4U2K1_9ARAC|nr:hypothetical protein CDAR_597291 [Caerostris darwini]